MTSTAYFLQPTPPPATPPPATPTTAGTSAGSGAPQQSGGLLGMLGSNPIVPMVAIFAVFYLLLIRPQQKKQRELQDWIKSIKKGDEVVTTGGVIGKVSGVTDHVVTLEVQEKVRMRILRSHIAGKAPGAGEPGPEPEKR